MTKGTVNGSHLVSEGRSYSPQMEGRGTSLFRGHSCNVLNAKEHTTPGENLS